MSSATAAAATGHSALRPPPVDHEVHMKTFVKTNKWEHTFH